MWIKTDLLVLIFICIIPQAHRQDGTDHNLGKVIPIHWLDFLGHFLSVFLCHLLHDVAFDLVFMKLNILQLWRFRFVQIHGLELLAEFLRVCEYVLERFWELLQNKPLRLAPRQTGNRNNKQLIGRPILIVPLVHKPHHFNHFPIISKQPRHPLTHIDYPFNQRLKIRVNDGLKLFRMNLILAIMLVDQLVFLFLEKWHS